MFVKNIHGVPHHLQNEDHHNPSTSSGIRARERSRIWRIESPLLILGVEISSLSVPKWWLEI